LAKALGWGSGVGALSLGIGRAGRLLSPPAWEFTATCSLSGWRGFLPRLCAAGGLIIALIPRPISFGSKSGCRTGDFAEELVDNQKTEFRMRHLAAAEFQRDFDFISSQRKSMAWLTFTPRSWDRFWGSIGLL